MRLAVLDIGSNTVHLLIVDAHTGGAPLPAHSNKHELRLAEHLEADGTICESGTGKLVDAVKLSLEEAEEAGAEDLLAFATSAIREAPNGEKVLAEVKERTGLSIDVLPGADEARLTFLAVRRWFGWSAGRILGLDIGGGSLEIATGRDEMPNYSISVPLGAGRLTRNFSAAGPVDDDTVKAMHKHIVRELSPVRHALEEYSTPDMVVGSSKSFRMLARACGAAPSSEGPYVKRKLNRDKLREFLDRIKEMPVEERSDIPGVNESRAPQLVAAALVAYTAMREFDVSDLLICPWALREGIILRRLEELRDPCLVHSAGNELSAGGFARPAPTTGTVVDVSHTEALPLLSSNRAVLGL